MIYIYGNDRRIDVIYGPLSSMDLITKVTSLVLWINVLSGKATVTSVSFCYSVWSYSRGEYMQVL